MVKIYKEPASAFSTVKKWVVEFKPIPPSPENDPPGEWTTMITTDRNIEKGLSMIL